MPLYRFTCTKCPKEITMLAKAWATAYFCPDCGGQLKKELPQGVNSVTREMKDAHRGVSHVKGQEGMMRERMRRHQERHELERTIDEHGIDDAIKRGLDKRVKRT